MKKNTLSIIGIILIITLFIGAGFLYKNLSKKYTSEKSTTQSRTSSTSSQSKNSTDEKAPDFKITDMNGKEVSLSEFFGKPIVLNFWASWCPPCKAEMPHFQKAFKENPDVQFIMVNASYNDSESSVKSFLENGGYTFPVLTDKRGLAFRAYNVSSLPTTYFIDKNGKVVSHTVGMLSEQRLADGIKAIK
ncbi:MAG: TlpA family protein disulfide reductase [Candidatus Fimenecus sp.]